MTGPFRRIRHLALLGALMFLAWRPSPAWSAPEGVILLHGLARTSDSMKPMADYLADQGYIVENIGYPSTTQSIIQLADSVIPDAMARETLADCTRIHFVTHSMGGILVRRYFSTHRDDRLGRVVMLGPPNQGSEVVDRIGSWRLFRKINGPAGNELGTDPRSIPVQLGPVPFETGVIAGDRSINWINSMMIKGSDDGKVSVARSRVEGMKDHAVVHATHPFMMRNREVMNLTLRFLRTGSFAPEP